MRKFLGNIVEDVCFLVGCGCLIYATSRWSLTAAFYAAGFLFIAVAVLIGLSGRGR